jgi:hypothetical protein
MTWSDARWDAASWAQTAGWATARPAAVWGRTRWSAEPGGPEPDPGNTLPPAPDPVPTPPPAPGPVVSGFGVVSERFAGPPYWACTHAAGVMARRWQMWEGHRPPNSSDEVLALAHASGDTTLHSGSNTSELVRGVHRRYGATWTPKRMTRHDFIAACTTPGSGVCIAVSSGDLPGKYRHWLGSFRGGHRVFIGCVSRGHTRYYDPMAPRNDDGMTCDPADIWPSVWNGEIIVVRVL